MNRAERRALKKRKPSTARWVPLPAMLDEFTIFDPVDTVLMQIKHGEMLFENDVPVFRGPKGELTEVCPAMDGWSYTWERISKGEVDMTAMKNLSQKLKDGLMLTDEDVALAETAILACKKYFRTHDRAEIQTQAKTAQIALLLGKDEQ